MRHLLVVLTSITATASSAAADGAPRLLDTIGVFETEVSAEVLPNAKPAWIPHYKFIVEFDGYGSEDVVLVQWKQGGAAIGKPVPCSSSIFVKDGQVNPQTAVVPANLAYFDCRHPKEAAITRSGAFSLVLVYKQTLANKQLPLGTLDLDVIELKQGSQNKQTSAWMASHDHRLKGATIEENVNSTGDVQITLRNAMLQHHDAARTANLGGPTHYTIRFWTKYKQGGPATMSMSCLLDGKKVTEARHAGGSNRSYWTFKAKERETGAWSQQVFQFYASRVYKQADEGSTVWMWSEHPGDYRCVATAGGEMVKEVFFTIGADGKIVESPCQAQVATLRHVHVIRAKDGNIANTPFDAKAARKGFFGHVAWSAGCPAGT